jgi:hypothetical protein
VSDLLLTVATGLDAPTMAHVHTVAFVHEVGDGTLRVRFCGPRATGVHSPPASAPLSQVLDILADATGDLDGQQVALFVPSHGTTATTAEDCHASRNYAVWISAPATTPDGYRL